MGSVLVLFGKILQRTASVVGQIDNKVRASDRYLVLGQVDSPWLFDPCLTFMKQVSLRFALLPGYQIRGFYYFPLYSLSSCFLLFADDVLEHVIHGF